MSIIFWEDCVNTCNEWLCSRSCNDNIINDNNCEFGDCYQLFGDSVIVSSIINGINYKNIGLSYHYVNNYPCQIILYSEFSILMHDLLEDGIKHSIDTGIIPDFETTDQMRIVIRAQETQGNCTIDSIRLYGTFITPFPTNVPTEIPTHVPTELPTNIPTKIPSINPTDYHTNHARTKYPSMVPTNIPSLIPSEIPSINPSLDTPIVMELTSMIWIAITIGLIVFICGTILSAIHVYIKCYRNNKSSESLAEAIDDNNKTIPSEVKIPNIHTDINNYQTPSQPKLNNTTNNGERNINDNDLDIENSEINSMKEGITTFDIDIPKLTTHENNENDA